MSRYYLAQSFLHWEDPARNREELGAKISECRDGIIVLPEMFTTGFSMASDRLAESMEDTTVAWMREQAASLNSTICGSQIIRAGNHYYNRFLWVTTDEVRHYDKRHLFRMADEHQHYSPGTGRLVVKAGALKLMAQVCYDLRFPAFSRNRGDYDALVYVANWPAARRDQWLTLLKSRAIENQAYVIAVNRVGQDGNGVNYAGDSCVIDFKGDMLLDLGTEDTIGSIELDAAALAEYRHTFPAYLDADDFDIRL